MALTGARSMSEYIARSAKFTNTQPSNIASAGLPTTTPGKTMSMVMAIKNSDGGTGANCVKATYGSNTLADTYYYYRSDLFGYAIKTSSTVINGFNNNFTAVPNGGWLVVFMDIDLSKTTNTIQCYVNGVAEHKSVSFTSDTITQFATAQLGTHSGLYQYTDGMAFAYMTTDYIDFSQESNRNLFVNQLGYPRDLTKEIDAGNIPTPLIYLPFDDTTNLGKNLGTGGDFVVNGSVTAGADFAI